MLHTDSVLHYYRVDSKSSPCIQSAKCCLYPLLMTVPQMFNILLIWWMTLLVRFNDVAHLTVEHRPPTLSEARDSFDVGLFLRIEIYEVSSGSLCSEVNKVVPTPSSHAPCRPLLPRQGEQCLMPSSHELPLLGSSEFPPNPS